MNLVNELQDSAAKEDVLTVLRKAKRLASKLGRQDIDGWLQGEQQGYTNDRDVPDYRHIGVTLGFKPMGYVPVGFGHISNAVQPLPSPRPDKRFILHDAISRVLSLIADGGGICSIVPNNSEEDQILRRMYWFDEDFADRVNFVWCLDDSQVKAIPEQVKDRVLDWACKLEAAGVTGEGHSFTDAEKTRAHSITFNILGSKIEQLNNMGSNVKE